MSDPQTVETGRSLFDYAKNSRNYTDPSGILWNFYGPSEVPGIDNSGVNAAPIGPSLYNLGDDFYRQLGYEGQAWNNPTLDQIVSGGSDRGSINPEFQKWLADKGYMYGEGMAGSTPYRGYFDQYGNPVGVQKGASDAGALGEFIRNAAGLYLGGQAFGALSGAGGAAGGGASALTGLDTAALDAATASQLTPAAFGSGAAAAGAATGAAGAGSSGAAGAIGTTLGVPNNLLGTGIAAGSQLLGGVLQNNANKDALEAQAKAQAESNALLKYMYDTQRSDQAPWMEAGKAALGNLTNLLNSGELTSKFAGKFDPSQVQMDPGYQFGMDQGQKAIANSAAARGMGLSGATLKAANKFGTDYATTKYDDAYNRAYGRYVDDFNRFYTEKANTTNPLFQIAGLGQTATNQVQQAGTNYANNASNNAIGFGNATAANRVNRGNIYGNMLANLGGLAYDYFNP